jgi:hypothetical protein
MGIKMKTFLFLSVTVLIMLSCTINRHYYVTINQEEEDSCVIIEVSAGVQRSYDADLGLEIPLL